MISSLISGCKDAPIQKENEVLDMSLIDPESVGLEIRSDSIRLTSDPNSCVNTDIYWYKNGTLSQSDGNNWVEADELNRLSTCGGFLFETSQKKGLDVKVLSDDFILSSRSLMNNIDEFYKSSENRDIPFSKAAMICILR